LVLRSSTSRGEAPGWIDCPGSREEHMCTWVVLPFEQVLFRIRRALAVETFGTYFTLCVDARRCTLGNNDVGRAFGMLIPIRILQPRG
jgi:hypothetical protein